MVYLGVNFRPIGVILNNIISPKITKDPGDTDYLNSVGVFLEKVTIVLG